MDVSCFHRFIFFDIFQHVFQACDGACFLGKLKVSAIGHELILDNFEMTVFDLSSSFTLWAQAWRNVEGT
jgi:hypothetical protein